MMYRLNKRPVHLAPATADHFAQADTAEQLTLLLRKLRKVEVSSDTARRAVEQRDEEVRELRELIQIMHDIAWEERHPGWVPPDDVLAEKITKTVVRQWPDYFISGPGRKVAETTDCGHGYRLTDSCPCCDAQQETT